MSFSKFFTSLNLRFGKYLQAHHITRAGLVALGLAAALVFFFVGAAIRLLVGPVSLGPFSGTLAGALAEALPGVSVKYDQAAVEWSRDQGRVELVILGARVFDADGRIIAQAPEAAIELTARSVFSGHPEVRRITLVGVQLTLVRTRDGGLRLGVGRDVGERDFLSNITDAITATSSKTSSLQAFAIRDARVAILDQVTGLFVIAPSANLIIKSEGRNLTSAFDAAVEISGRPAHVHASITIPPGKGPVSGDLLVEGLDVGALGANARTFELLKGIALTANLSSSFVIDHGAHLSSADFGLDAHGTIGMPQLLKAPINVRSAKLVGRYDGASGRIVIDDGSFQSDAAAFHLVGDSILKYDLAHDLTAIVFESTGDRITLAARGLVESPIGFSRLAIRGTYIPGAREIDLERAALRGDAFSAETSGKIGLVPGMSPYIALKGEMGALPVNQLLHYWPLTIGQGARDWVLKNFIVGRVGPVTFDMDLPAGIFGARALPENALHVTIPVTDAVLHYLGKLTPLSHVSATSTLTGNSYTADLVSGDIGPVRVTEAHFGIADLSAPGSPATIAAHVEGDMHDLLALLDQQPLGYPTKYGIDPADTKGNAVLDLMVALPLIKDLGVDQVKIGAKAAVTNLDIALGKRARLTNAALTFVIDNKGMSADGSARLGGAPLTLAWKEDFESTAPVTTHINAKGLLDDPARDTLGLGTAQFLKGPVGFEAAITGRHGQLSHADVALDLTSTTLAFDPIGIEKPAGQSARGSVTVSFSKGNIIREEDIHFIGPGGSVDALLSYGDDGVLAVANLPVVHYGADDFSFHLAKIGNTSTVVIRGRSLDGSGFAHAGTSSARGSSFSSGQDLFDGPYDISARLDRVVLRDGVSIAPFALEANGAGSKIGSLSLKGNLGGGAKVSGAIVPGPSRHATFETDDAAQLARGLFGVDGLRGGKLSIAATFLPDAAKADPKTQAADFSGTVLLKNVTVQHQPFVARLLSMASFAGIGNLLQGSGLQIEKIEVPFSSKDNVISVHGAIASGPTIGVTADGYIDRPSDQVALKGSLIPVLGIDFNSILSAIPLFGNILTSKKGEGILAVTYAVNGNAEQPSVTVNPLAMLTPGILRRIFQGQMPTAPPPPPVASSQNSPKPTPR